MVLEQRFAHALQFTKERITLHAVVRALSVITTLNRSILELEGTVKKHMIQLFYFTDGKIETQSS